MASSRGRALAQRAPGPWPTLPARVGERLGADIDGIARRVARRLTHEIGLPAEYQGVAYLRSVLQACRDGVRTLVRQLHDGSRPQPAELRRLGAAGRRQAEMGVPLEVLLRAYRLAARQLWQEIADEVARTGGLEPSAALQASDQVLAYLDDISDAVGRAYLQTREEIVRRRGHERDQVLRRLLAGDASDELRRAAATCGLELEAPYRALACRVAVEGIDVERTLTAAWGDWRALLLVDEGSTWMALVDGGADPGELCRVGERATRRAAARSGAPTPPLPLVIGVGPVTATLAGVADSGRRARRALQIGERVDPSQRVHLGSALGLYAALLSDRAALAADVAETLSPLEEGRRGPELVETLEAVLGARTVAGAAAALGIHRHTVIYRLERISERLGADLTDPQTRFRLQLALIGRRLLA